MKPPSEQELTAWGRSSASVSREWHVESADEAATGMRAAGERGVIARGFARSYGDACLNDGGDVVNVRALASIRSFDAQAGTLWCDAGTSFETIMRHCVPHGWQPPVCPGTAFVSMGGAVANDIHGKNHHDAGSFGDHVDWLELLLPDGSVRRVAPGTDAELFAATVGGIGLTGVILSLQLRLARAVSNAIVLREQRVPNLDAFLELLTANEREYPHIVGWIDALTPGRQMGRGILQLGQPSREGVRERRRSAVTIPFDFPSAALNRYTVGAFNEGYFRHIPSAGRERRIHIDRFLYPLDSILNWNRMYGRRGVYQFQCVVPFADGRRAMIEIMEEIVRSRCASFLAVIKSMGRNGRGLLSFPMPGFTLALDFARSVATRQLVERLYAIAQKHGGRIYLAKDACLAPEQFATMYPELPRFRALLQRIDPNGVMQSDMSRRLNLRPT